VIEFYDREDSRAEPDHEAGAGRRDESKVRQRLGRQLVVDWQAEHGAFTAEELATARAEMTAADAATPTGGSSC